MKRIVIKEPKEIREDIIEIPRERLVDLIDVDPNVIRILDASYLKLRNNAYYLTGEYDWVLGKDELGIIVLVPLRKVGEK